MRAKFPYKKRRKRLGCGIGSGHGKTSTKGHKGQKARSGYALRPGFEGGQNPLYRRMPKRGFNHNAFRRSYAIVNVGSLESLSESEIAPDTLISHGLVKDLSSGIKVLGGGSLQKAFTVKAHRFSESARTKIEKAGGKAVLLES